jgi:hypothetical protein
LKETQSSKVGQQEKKTEIKTTQTRSHNKDAHLKSFCNEKFRQNKRDKVTQRKKIKTQGDERKEEGEINK